MLAEKIWIGVLAHVACSQDVLCFVAGLTSRHTAKFPSNASLGGGQFRCNILGSIIKSLVDRVASATLSHQTVMRSLGLAGSTRSLDDLATRVACVTSLRLYVLNCVATILLLIASRSSIVAFSSSCHVPFTISNPCSQWDGHVCPAACGSWCRSTDQTTCCRHSVSSPSIAITCFSLWRIILNERAPLMQRQHSCRYSNALPDA